MEVGVAADKEGQELGVAHLKVL
ncbi:TPA_asm: UL40.6 sORF 2 [Human alphaherpesvirus 1]|nr:TPA_asm: UL40.6 sORF 2 [Human alphaherpesvirus 1]